MRRVLVLALVVPGLLGAQAPVRAAFALVSALQDTVAVERWVRWGDRTEALITRDGHAWFHLIADTDPESGTERLAFTSYDPAPEGVAGVSFSHEVVVRDSIATVRDAVTGEVTDRLVVPIGTIPFLPASLALVERRLLADPALRGHQASLVQQPVLSVGPTGALLDTLQFVVTGTGGDSLWSHLRWHDLIVAHRPDGTVEGARSLDATPALAYRPLDPSTPWPPRPRGPRAPPRSARGSRPTWSARLAAVGATPTPLPRRARGRRSSPGRSPRSTPRRHDRRVAPRRPLHGPAPRRSPEAGDTRSSSSRRDPALPTRRGGRARAPAPRGRRAG